MTLFGEISWTNFFISSLSEAACWKYKSLKNKNDLVSAYISGIPALVGKWLNLEKYLERALAKTQKLLDFSLAFAQ